jgi:hypothetical protein
MTTLNPPYRFGYVETHILRGSYPKSRNIPFLSGLGLNTLLSLTPEPISLETDSSFKNVIHVKIEKPKESIPLTFSKVFQILAILTDTHLHPIYVHCLDGSTVTSIIIMAFRKLQAWPVSAWTAEASRYLRDGVLSTTEREFMDKLMGEYDVPAVIPKFLWNGIPTKKHPYFKLKYPSPVKTATGAESPKTTPAVPKPLEDTAQGPSLSSLKLQMQKEDLRRVVHEKLSPEKENDETLEKPVISRTLEALDLDISSFTI